MIAPRRRTVVPFWHRRRFRDRVGAAERYLVHSDELEAVVVAKAAVINRVGQRDGNWLALSRELSGLLKREARICQRLSRFRADEGDLCAAFLADAWAGHLRTVNAQQYVEQTWLDLAEDSLGGGQRD
ncbi:hypothetical protein [Fodinicola acaciae]|uniref:hypothetical protein n=1 Tax=Fodinicola acaciae TaxID=2681555 RepID=UPI0013D1F252|nr:hypothetical protein [Fodinicola acaciae]